MIGYLLSLSSKDMVRLAGALWADELLADLVSSANDEKKRCFALLQSLWYHPDARAWFKIVVFSKERGRYCIGQHPEFKTYAPHSPHEPVRGRLGIGSSITKGRPKESAVEILGRQFVTPRALTDIRDAIRTAYAEAMAALKRKAVAVPEIAEMLLIFARVARGTPAERNMLEALRALDENALSPVDRRYRARALYMLNDDKALCDYIRLSERENQGATLLYYAQQASDDGTGTKTLDLLRSHIEFHAEQKSAPLLTLYARTAKELIVTKRDQARGWSSALEDLGATRKLDHTLSAIVQELAGGSDGRHAGRYWRDHKCSYRKPAACLDLARTAVSDLQDTIRDFRDVLSQRSDQAVLPVTTS
jgi:hypothetical protein